MSFDETIKLISIIVSILALLGVGTIMTMFWHDKHDKKKKEIEENSQLKEQNEQKKLQDVIEKTLEAKLAPVVKKLDEMEADIGNIKRGVQVSNRTDLENMWEKAEKQGWCSDYDKKRFESTYQAYHALGKNGVMDNKHTKIIDMPEHPPVPARKSRTKLNEGKK